MHDTCLQAVCLPGYADPLHHNTEHVTDYPAPHRDKDHGNGLSLDSKVGCKLRATMQVCMACCRNVMSPSKYRVTQCQLLTASMCSVRHDVLLCSATSHRELLQGQQLSKIMTTENSSAGSHNQKSMGMLAPSLFNNRHVTKLVRLC